MIGIWGQGYGIEKDLFIYIVPIQENRKMTERQIINTELYNASKTHQDALQRIKTKKTYSPLGK